MNGFRIRINNTVKTDLFINSRSKKHPQKNTLKIRGRHISETNNSKVTTNLVKKLPPKSP